MIFIIKDLEKIKISEHNNFYEAKKRLIELNKYGKYYLLYRNDGKQDRLVTDHEFYLFGER